MSVLKRHKVSTDDQTSSVLDALGHSTLLNDNKKKRNAALDEWLNRHALLSWPRLLTDDVSQRVTCGVRRLMDTHNRIVFVNGSRIARRGYFEAGSRHRYSTSVTEWVNNELFSAFDDTAVAQRCARSLKYGESVDSPEAIKRAWKIVGRAARDCGVRTHAYVEKRLAMRSGDVDVNRLPLECQLFDSWWTGAQHAHWKALCTEVRLGHREWDLAGTFDALLLDDVGRVVLVDWKVSKKAMNRSGYGRVKKCTSTYRRRSHGFTVVALRRAIGHLRTANREVRRLPSRRRTVRGLVAHQQQNRRRTQKCHQRQSSTMC